TLQTQIFRAAFCENIHAQKASGNGRTGRRELQLLLEFLRPGYPFMVTRVDRLARGIKNLQDIVYSLNQQGVTLRA
ncbi:recombinase family protein, partial [Salmonella enterica]|uniref:recombinase family protein n=1 Tax=Salmonella enterica TaxID=28901 RepID=UPI0004637854